MWRAAAVSQHGVGSRSCRRAVVVPCWPSAACSARHLLWSCATAMCLECGFHLCAWESRMLWYKLVFYAIQELVPLIVHRNDRLLLVTALDSSFIKHKHCSHWVRWPVSSLSCKFSFLLVMSIFLFFLFSLNSSLGWTLCSIMPMEFRRGFWISALRTWHRAALWGRKKKFPVLFNVCSWCFPLTVNFPWNPEAYAGPLLLPLVETRCLSVVSPARCSCSCISALW